MGKGGSMKSSYEVIAYITMDTERVLGGKALTLLARSEEEQKTFALDIAKAVKADIVKLSSGDYMIIS